jgi:hypothetical protein
MLGAGLDDVLAGEGGHRHEAEVVDVEPGDEVGVVATDAIVDLLVVADEVHLVDGDDQVLDAEEGADEAVAAGLRHDAVAGVDQDDRQVAVAGPGGHVAGVLLVAGAVGDDELAAVGAEVAVGDVDGDALLTLGAQAVGEQREVDAAAGGALFDGVAADGGELVLVDLAGVVEEAADEGALAVVDAAAGEQAQELFLLVALEVLRRCSCRLKWIHGMAIRSSPPSSSVPCCRPRRGR